MKTTLLFCVCFLLFSCSRPYGNDILYICQDVLEYDAEAFEIAEYSSDGKIVDMKLVNDNCIFIN